MERTESARLCTYDCERCIIDMRRYFWPQQPNPFDIFGTQADELQDKLFAELRSTLDDEIKPLV